MSFTLPKTHAEATQQFEMIRNTIKDEDPSCEIILPSIAGWSGCGQLNTWLLASSNNGIDYEDTLFGDLIRLCFPNNTEMIINRYFEQLCSIFTALLTDANTCADLLDWFEGCIRQYQIRIDKNDETRRDIFTPTDLYIFGLAHLIIRLCADALAKSGNIQLNYPDAFLLYDDDNLFMGSFSQTLALCQAANLPSAQITSQTIYLFHLAHCAIKVCDDSYSYWEPRTQRIRCPLQRAGHKLLPFYSTTASWMLLVTELNEIPYHVFYNLTSFCATLHVSDNSPDTYNTNELRQIVQSMVALVGAANLYWETRAELMEGLMLLVPYSRPRSSAAQDTVPRPDWYVLLAPLHPSETSDWRLQVVPALLQLFMDVVRGRDHRLVYDSVSIYRLLPLIGYFFRIPEQLALIRNLAKGPDLRRFAGDVLDRTTMKLTAMCNTKRQKAKVAAAAVAIAPAEDRESEEEARNERHIHSEIVHHLLILDKLISSVPEMCHEPDIAQPLASLLNGLLHHWMSTPEDWRTVGESMDLTEFIALLSSMFQEMAKCEAFFKWTAQLGQLRHIWWLSDTCCQSADLQLVASPNAPNFPELRSRNRQLHANLVHFERLLAKEMLVQAALTTTAPDDFQDTITMQLMQNPVRLPVSKKVMDMSTIQRHFQLGKLYDPFTRTPLGLDQVQSQAELRQQITKWKRKTRRRQESIFDHARAECVYPYFVPTRRKPDGLPGQRMDLLVSNWWMEQYGKRQQNQPEVVDTGELVRSPRKRRHSNEL